ncbi:polysaccharide pyruvyl transferase family protein [Thalassotalea euphylliae]|uniref:polysaccharide pyruvyl transferase family protein n=1 Tax=Thalassotalea euphylliae TaxID=1655234 RepID=UPI003636689D
MFSSLPRKILSKQRKLKAKLLGNGVDTYWWSGRVNFGDLISEELLKVNGKTPILKEPSNAQLVMVGSLIEHLPEDYSGTIMGTGLISEKKASLPQANFLAVRGKYTRQCLGLKESVPLGDFGLLSHKLIGKQPAKKYKYGLIPHYVDKTNPWIPKIHNYLGQDCVIIDVEDTATSVTQQIAECEFIFSSSLHGLIVADSFGIPNTWLQMSDKVIGNGFKFHDYNSAIDSEQQCVNVSNETTLDDLEAALSTKSFDVIREKQDELDNILTGYLSRD